MPTRRGWALGGAVLGLVIGWRILGLPHLLVLAVIATVLLMLSLLRLRSVTLDLRVDRSVPERLSVGSQGHVELTVTNRSGRALPTTFATDRFGAAEARLRLPPLAARGIAHASYRIPTERRGRYRVGPLRLTTTDPFGLASRSTSVGEATDVLVCPRIHDVLVPPESSGDDRDWDARPVHQHTDTGGEFLTLREYELGDDLRRVHWRSTARTGTLMIRQHQAPRRAPAVVVLDVRPGAHDETSFEIAVEAAGSILSAIERAGRPVTMVTTTGAELGNPGRRHVESVLDELAVIEPHGPDRIAVAIGRNRAASLIAVTGTLSRGDPAALGALARSRGSMILVDATRAASDALPPSRDLPALIVAAGGGEPFASVWNNAILTWHRDTNPLLRSSRSPA